MEAAKKTNAEEEEDNTAAVVSGAVGILFSVRYIDNCAIP